MDFPNEVIRPSQQLDDLGQIAPTKGKRVRAVPMVRPVAQALAALSRHGLWQVAAIQAAEFPSHARTLARLRPSASGPRYSRWNECSACWQSCFISSAPSCVHWQLKKYSVMPSNRKAI